MRSAAKNLTKPATAEGQLDPLFVIFEQHLYNFQDSESDRKSFVSTVIKDYLSYLRKMNILIPKSLENAVVEELSSQVNTMLVKKIYGCLTLEEFQKNAAPAIRKRARARYSRLKG